MVMTAIHTLLLLRHAKAVDSTAGRRDHERPLSEQGLEQATQAGAAMRDRGLAPDLVLCSDATRTRQTWEQLDLAGEVEFTDAVYNAGSDALLDLVRMLDEAVATAMIIGHGPGLPQLAVDLAGSESDRHAVDVIAGRYPTATLTEFAVDGPWTDLQVGRLDWVRLGK